MKTPEVESQASQGCFACRLIGGFGCTGASLYVGYMASKNTHPIGKKLTFLFAGALGGIGIARLFNFPPFNRQKDKDLTNL